jgi:tetratricopeptide (TPR) repeat protein
MVLALGLGIMIALYEKSPARQQSGPTHVLSKLWLVAPAALLSFLIYFGFVKMNFEHRSRRAISYRDLKKHEQVLVEVAAGRNPLVTLAPRGFTIENFAILAYSALGNHEAALEMARRAQELNPWHIQTWDQRAWVRRMGSWEKSLHCHLETLRLAPQRKCLRFAGTAYYKLRLFCAKP